MIQAVSPIRDPGFWGNGVHGADAQRQVIQAALRRCRQRMTAVDVGAHIGVWSRALLDAGFKRVVAFEPVEENRVCLEKNAPGAKVLRAALGSTVSTCGMVLPDGGNSGMWHAEPGKDQQVLPLDLYELEDVDLLKIDTEGWEGHVLLGAISTVHRCSPVVVFEDNGLGQKYYGAQWVDPKIVLAELGYSMKQRIRKDEIWCR